MAWLAEPHSEGSDGVRLGAPDGSTDARRRSTSTLTHRLLAALGVPAGAVVAALREADQQDDGGDAATVLMAWGVLDPAEWWPALAAALGLGYRAHIEPVPAGAAPIPAAALDREARLIWTADPTGPLLAVAPCGDTTARLSAFLATHPMLRSRVVVTSAEAVRAGLRQQMRATMTEAAVTGLRRSRPDMSASRPPRAWPVRLAGALLAASPFAAVLLGFGVEALLLAVFLPLTLLRLMAAIDPVRPRPPPRVADGDLPRYAVLVPLHHEATMLPQLAAALAALDYPRHKLDLKLLIEADDAPTYAAAMAYAGQGGWDVVVVPPSLPRTKPKALAFGLQLVDAEFVTVFDAEDRPAPDQLRRAAAALMAAPADVACLQAALTIDRRAGAGWSRRGWAGGWLAGQFALEYRIQFFGLLPWFAARWGFFLLGGTSNHFRHAALAAVGGWDPYNVTEDADIAVRLRRGGWRIGVLASETLEEAPSSPAVWSAQRCRWLKGWMRLLAPLPFLCFFRPLYRLRPHPLLAVATSSQHFCGAPGRGTSRGFRTTASTLLNESGRFSPDAIERALAHQDADTVRRAYARGAYWAERVEMAQWWSDYLDALKAAKTVVPFPMRA